ncbi:choline dehydrogenase [Segetibacter sp. 3557_3]|uniref:GMC family oxidoreductase n=1 Tax=Segetibacter sp. 3557_3 TaxID=2547429 RepID=UPI001058DD85|nr:GMC family oxidoreductase N-terminal domain-containing protein [Segetibacter sp. 3557_3]TDH26382.1 choline dehydrogenase [Segetibacter sp. 3557_3]
MPTSNFFNPKISTRRDFIKTGSILSIGYAISSYAGVEADSNKKNNYDYIIIGAGSSGCVIANKLTEDPSVKVLLLEAGARDTKPEIHQPGQWLSLKGTEVDWQYATQEEPFLNNRKIDWPRGKVLGGSSAINAMIYLRGHFSDYDRWAALGNKGWTHKEVFPYFTQLENYPYTNSNSYGKDGPLHISRKTCPEGPCTPFVQAAMELGYNGPNWDLNGLQQENGAGLCPLTVKDGKRQSAATAFLKPVVSRPNLVIITSAQVTRLLFSRKRVTGVEYLLDGKLSEVNTQREVIICTGAVDTPKLLMLSGIGPVDHLRSLRIKVKVDLPGVGQNLQDHVQSSISYRSKLAQVNNTDPEWSGLFVYTSKAPRHLAPDLQFLFHQWPGSNNTSSFMFIPIVAKPKSRGAISLQSTNPLQPPLIRANYLQNEEDLRTLIEGYKLTTELAGTLAFLRLRSDSGPELKSEQQMIERIRSTASTMFHPVGTCKMGIDEMSVVEPDLRVYGVDGLRIADASIMPEIVNTNTNATCIMIGAYGADKIRNTKS